MGNSKLLESQLKKKLKSGGPPEHIKQKKSSFKIYILISIYFVYNLN